MRKRCWPNAVLLVAVALLLVGASPSAERIRSVDRKERTIGYKEFLGDHQATVSSLMRLLGDQEAVKAWSQAARAAGKEDDWRTPMTVAMRLLGDFRAPEAVPLLFEHLTYDKPWTKVTDSWTIGDRYPAAGALAKIGMPAVRPAIDRIKTAQDELERRVCVWILTQVEGVAVARLRLEHELQVEEKSLYRFRLREALGVLEKLYASGNPFQWEAGVWERQERSGGR